MWFIFSLKVKELTSSKGKIIVPLSILLIIIVSVTTIICLARKEVTVVIDGEQQTVVTFKNSVEELFTQENIILDEKDKVDKALQDKIKNKDIIHIKKAVNVKVTADGTEQNIKTAEDTIEDMLKVEGISLNPEDKVFPDMNSTLYEGLQVKIVRVVKETITETVPIDFETVVKDDNNIAYGHNKIVQEGEKGEKQITFEVTYEDGVEVSKNVVNETIIKQPRNKIVARGTMSVLPVSRGGATVGYSRVFTARATAYYAVNGVGKTYTASGRKAVRDPAGFSTIAVDPSVIPYGTKLYVEGYGFAIAADTGTSIKGNKIDVFFNTYKEACNWGVRNVKVYVLK